MAFWCYIFDGSLVPVSRSSVKKTAPWHLEYSANSLKLKLLILNVLRSLSRMDIHLDLCHLLLFLLMTVFTEGFPFPLIAFCQDFFSNYSLSGKHAVFSNHYVKHVTQLESNPPLVFHWKLIGEIYLCKMLMLHFLRICLLGFLYLFFPCLWMFLRK